MIRSSGASGSAAIRESLALVYGDQESIDFNTIQKYADGGNDPLDAFSVFLNERAPAHWHYVSYGFTDLDEKENDDLISSGYGFELTFRLRRMDEATPPIWPMKWMQLIARYVFQSGHALEVGDSFDFGKEIIDRTGIEGVAFAVDPELGEVRTGFGHVKYLQMVALDRRELAEGVARALDHKRTRDALCVAHVGSADREP